MAAARALAMAAARRRVAPGAQATPSPAPAAALLGPRVARPSPAATAALLGPRAAPAVARAPTAPSPPLLEDPRAAPPLAGRPALAAALLHGPRAPPLPGGRPASAPARDPLPPPRAAALVSPRALTPPLGARLLRLLPAPAPLAAALGPHRLLSTEASFQPGRDEAKRTASVESGFARDAAAADGNKTSHVVDMSGRGGANSKVLTRDTKIPGEGGVPAAAASGNKTSLVVDMSGSYGADSKVLALDTKLPGEDEVAAAKATSGGVLEKAGAFNLGAPSAHPAALFGPRSPHLLGGALASLRLLQPTTPMAAAHGGLLRFSTGVATILPNGDARDTSAAPNSSKRRAGATNSAGKEEPKHAAADTTTRADGENIDNAKTKPGGRGGGIFGDPRGSPSNGEGHDKTKGGRTAEELVLDKVREMLRTAEEVILDKVREMMAENSKKEMMREGTRAFVMGQIIVCEVVFFAVIAVIYGVKIYREKMAIILDGKKGELEEV